MLSAFRNRKSEERIVAAAMRLGDLTISLPPPARHDALMSLIRSEIGQVVQPAHQGFLTSEGRFVSRQDAAAIAVAARQVKRDCMLLTSQHLW
ncbi:MAG: hypothetical protein E5V60_03555 [Mesorhizobium sp.]|jgi:hypothetical protein|uniref:hypothetical protein n=1 Tax=Mesorhizobium sp. TaxID=1871066 RepID=UPI000FE4C220|nr:hypothetical protein [Mesorhizobium sp.]RWP57419.1 MAG: hypothetical protein EOR08_30800 [Mesorhizobium sp.]TIW68781.1 MAG: hypothetical protein E5V60_03555 [Mesorhizobium sp.]